VRPASSIWYRAFEARLHGILPSQRKETDVSILKTSTEAGTRAKTIVLLDCGQASKVTRGFPFLVFLELGWPPFDRLLF
jgi:hypothetical protein